MTRVSFKNKQRTRCHARKTYTQLDTSIHSIYNTIGSYHCRK